jgi:hypothetical protein
MDRRVRPRKGWSLVLLLSGAALVFTSIMGQLGVGPVYLFRQFELREAMERRILKGLPDEALTILRFTEREFEEISLYDGGQELELDDTMYDIVSMETRSGNVVVKAVRDGDETRLNKDLDRMVEAHLATDQRGKHHRSCVIASWAPFCELLPRMSFLHQPMAEPVFGHPCAFIGRENVPVDPGPPRLA